MLIVIPMAGLSRRFREAGYRQPKYMLEANGRTLFAHAVGSFAGQFDDAEFLFIARSEQQTPQFIQTQAEGLGIRKFTVVVLDEPTRGQAETVAIGLTRAAVPANTSIVIFNIDTFRPGWAPPSTFDPGDVDGYLEVFEGYGDGWSFVLPTEPGSDRVTQTAEKIRISALCSTGLYHFRRAGDFMAAFEEASAAPPETWDAGELYVAPLYNHLIRNGADIRYHQIKPDQVVFCGVPAEYEALRAERSAR